MSKGAAQRIHKARMGYAPDAYLHEALQRLSFLWKRWWMSLIVLAVGTVSLNLAVIPKTTLVIEELVVRSIWFSVEERQLCGLLDTARTGLTFYSIASGLRMGVLILFCAVLARTSLILGGLEAPLHTCGTAAVILASVLFVKEALGALCIALISVDSATIDSLRFRAGLSLFLDTGAWGPAPDYLLDEADLFGVGSVLLSCAWLRRRLDLTWRMALCATLLPALVALSVGLALHLALSSRLGHIGIGPW